MSTEPIERARRENVEFSAGGVVVRGDEVVVIMPTRRGAGGAQVLALPKGHPEPGESAEQAAAREVREEAGVWGDLIESLGEVAYTYERKGHHIAKRVEFFLIEYRGGDPADHDHEVDEARWMPISRAALALTYEGERAVLAQAISRRPLGL
jgi:ADP-ribose pyrophosphatase YjhB (NUDIX family)